MRGGEQGLGSRRDQGGARRALSAARAATAGGRAAHRGRSGIRLRQTQPPDWNGFGSDGHEAKRSRARRDKARAVRVPAAG